VALASNCLFSSSRFLFAFSSSVSSGTGDGDRVFCFRGSCPSGALGAGCSVSDEVCDGCFPVGEGVASFGFSLLILPPIVPRRGFSFGRALGDGGSVDSWDCSASGSGDGGGVDCFFRPPIVPKRADFFAFGVVDEFLGVGDGFF
jgi:hypothetical protein